MSDTKKSGRECGCWTSNGNTTLMSDVGGKSHMSNKYNKKTMSNVRAEIKHERKKEKYN